MQMYSISLEETAELSSPDAPFITFRREPTVALTATNNQPNSGLFSTKVDILDGKHPVPIDDCIQFAAYQVQIQFGDHKEDKHKPGILE